jgi:Domain of unknown function (DUF5063)
VNQAAEFRRIAEEYCSLVEGARATDPDEFLDRLLKTLPALYAAGRRLPGMAPASDKDLPDRPTDDEWKAVYEGLGEALPADYYRSVEPFPIESDDEPSLGSLADDLADIWRDIREGLLALEAGSPEADVVFHWRFLLSPHWGRHAADALAALHALESA